jgi:hypothetical protein
MPRARSPEIRAPAPISRRIASVCSPRAGAGAAGSSGSGPKRAGGRGFAQATAEGMIPFHEGAVHGHLPIRVQLVELAHHAARHVLRREARERFLARELRHGLGDVPREQLVERRQVREPRRHGLEARVPGDVRPARGPAEAPEFGVGQHRERRPAVREAQQVVAAPDRGLARDARAEERVVGPGVRPAPPESR